MAEKFNVEDIVSYDEYLRKLEENNECPCCPLLDRLPNDIVIHQMHKAIQTENLKKISDILENVRDITLKRDFEVVKLL